MISIIGMAAWDCALNHTKFFDENSNKAFRDIITVVQFIFDNFYFKFYKTGVLMSVTKDPDDQLAVDMRNAIMNKSNFLIPPCLIMVFQLGL